MALTLPLWTMVCDTHTPNPLPSLSISREKMALPFPEKILCFTRHSF